MEEFKPGDRVIDDGGRELTVHAVRGEWAWVFSRGGLSGNLRHFESLKKVEPKWEVGKWYGFHASDQRSIRVTAVDPDGNALIRTALGAIGCRSHTDRANHEESARQ